MMTPMFPKCSSFSYASPARMPIAANFCAPTILISSVISNLHLANCAWGRFWEFPGSRGEIGFPHCLEEPCKRRRAASNVAR